MTGDKPQIKWNRAEVAKRLEERGARVASAPPTPGVSDTAEEARRDAYRAAAAVLVSFSPASLNPFDLEKRAPLEAVQYLAAECAVVDATKVEWSNFPHRPDASQAQQDAETQGASPERETMYRWMLDDDPRREALRRLKSSRLMSAALEANPDRLRSPMQQMYELYIQLKAPPVEVQTVEQLACTLQVAQWLWGILPDMPDPTVVRRRLQRERLLAPFRGLVGEHFRGREKELQTLREYVGVLPPGNVLGAVRRGVRDFFGFKEKPPLLIYGVGGIGKSTLLSKFILEHAAAAERERFPFVYLDFNEQSLVPTEPLTLLVAAVLQLAAAYPDHARPLDEYRHYVQDMLAGQAERGQHQQSTGSFESSEASPSTLPLEPVGPEERDAARRAFASVVTPLMGADQPLLLVLDTFEEAQYRAPDSVRDLWEFLEALQRDIPRLRVVVAGRASIDDVPAQQLALAEFDSEAAAGLLESLGVRDPVVAGAVAQQVGGSPLSLRLAAEVILAGSGTEAGEKGIHQLRTRNWFSSVSQAQVRGQLYRRVLSHVHDPNVRELARVGMVLRRVTADLIQAVLAEPAGVPLPDPQTAQRLFDELSRESGLVAWSGDERGGTSQRVLHFKRDLRRSVLPLLWQENSKVVRDVHTRAVQYYAAQSDVAARTEELYHRLSSEFDRATLNERWDQRAAPALKDAIDELPPRGQAYLAARLKMMQLPQEVWAQADLEDWEQHAAVRVKSLLQSARVEDALKVLGERTERSSFSPLLLLDATGQFRSGRMAEAGGLAARASAAASAAGDRRADVEARRLLAQIAEAKGNFADARRLLEGALAETDPADAVTTLEICFQWLDLARGSDAPPEGRERFDERIADAVRGAKPADFRHRAPLLWRAAAEVAERQPKLLLRVLSIAGLPHLIERERLALIFTAWDEGFSQGRDEPPGALARIAGVPLARDVHETWSSFLESATTEKATEMLLRLFERVTPITSVARALAKLMKIHPT